MAGRHRQAKKARRARGEKLERVDCGECGKPAGLVTGEVVYPHRPDLAAKLFWRCGACEAYVGCHAGTKLPLGTPAGPVTRLARNGAHAAFDPLWRLRVAQGQPQHLARGKAYAWLAEQLQIPVEQCHIGMMDVATARRVEELCAPIKRKARL